MKVKCKECQKKFRLHSPLDVDCVNSTCPIKYNMSHSVIGFRNKDGSSFFEENMMKDVHTIEQWNVPERPVYSYPQSSSMSDTEWAEWITKNIGEYSD